MRVEAETAALRTYVGQHSLRITSALSVVEVRRAAMRSGIREERKKADEVLDSVVVIKLVPEMLDLAAALDPPTLRSLDAIHLATAMFHRLPVRLVAADTASATRGPWQRDS